MIITETSNDIYLMFENINKVIPIILKTCEYVKCFESLLVSLNF